MQSAEALLEIIHERGKRGLPLVRLYRCLFNPELYLRAYGKIYRNDGALTPGTTAETVDGMSLAKIQAIIEALRDERYRWTPARRVYINKKGSAKKRPLGLPSWSDKLLQEVIRSLLEAYYEPQFSARSHGFRPRRGCHTALQEIQRGWAGTVWFVEGDISQCFDRLDHAIMHGILAEKIHDNRFLRLIDGLLQAGYLEEWHHFATLSGSPQGGIVSPILANIYLDRLDQFIETELLPAYNRGGKRKTFAPYMRTWRSMRSAEREGRDDQARALRRELQHLPSRDPNDPRHRRLRYCRYADDWILGFCGPRREAEEIKDRIRTFLRDHLKLELSEPKTLITHGRTQSARFLGYDIAVLADDHKHDKRGHRSINGRIGLKVPVEVLRGTCEPYLSGGKPAPRLERTGDTDFNIVARYQAEYRGIVEYYQLAYNRHRFTRLKYITERSLTKTLGHKNQISVTKVYRRYRATLQTAQGPRKVLRVRVEREGGRKPLEAIWGGISLAHKRFGVGVTLNDDPAVFRKGQRSELVRRLLAGSCELCGSRDGVSAHHIRRLADLPDTAEGGSSPWAEQMAKRRRKSLIVCLACHESIHISRSTRHDPRNKALESRVR
ncbi:MAG TPA: reverse transcriptase domain-containing protein [bacterium]|nr:reverse transcriptase domain-containing protein [bacterium]